MILTHANRGESFEVMIEQANQVYNAKGKAIITKIPTPWKVLRKYSPITNSYKIQGAFPEKKSTVDFGGTASNYSIWFDAKETKNKTSLPLGNIKKHQIDYLENVAKQGGKAFFLVHATVLKRTWVLWIDQFIQFLAEYDRKSIRFDWMDEHCEVVPSGIGVMLDYLPIVLKRKF
jgi:recombination protein U